MTLLDQGPGLPAGRAPMTTETYDALLVALGFALGGLTVSLGVGLQLRRRR